MESVSSDDFSSLTMSVEAAHMEDMNDFGNLFDMTSAIDAEETPSKFTRHLNQANRVPKQANIRPIFSYRQNFHGASRKWYHIFVIMVRVKFIFIFIFNTY